MANVTLFIYMIQTDKSNGTVTVFAMSYNDVASLQSNTTLSSEGLSAFVASGILSISVTTDGKKESIPVQYKQALVQVGMI